MWGAVLAGVMTGCRCRGLGIFVGGHPGESRVAGTVRRIRKIQIYFPSRDAVKAIKGETHLVCEEPSTAKKMLSFFRVCVLALLATPRVDLLISRREVLGWFAL